MFENKKGLILIFLIILVLVGSALFFFTSKKPSQSNQSDAQAEKEQAVLKETLDGLGTFTTRSTRENKDVYLRQINTHLDSDTLSEWTRLQLLARKAIALSIMVGAPVETEVAEAMRIFRDFLLSPDKTEGGKYLKDFAVAAGTKLQFQIRALPQVSLIDTSAENYKYYKTAGYSDLLATHLALYDLTKEITPERKLDIVHTNNEMVLASMILLSGESKLQSNPLYEKIARELKQDLTLAEENKLQPLFFKDIISATIEPKYHYATGYDAYYSHPGTTVTPEINQQIDTRYEEAIAAAKSSPEFRKNSVLDQVLFYSQISYLASLDRRYGDNVDTKKISDVARSLLSTIRSSKEISALSASYITSEKYDEVKHLVNLGKKNQEIADYLNSLR